jgi:hypothetical protein
MVYILRFISKFYIQKNTTKSGILQICGEAGLPAGRQGLLGGDAALFVLRRSEAPVN